MKRLSKHRVGYFFLLAGLLLFTFSCSTKKNTWTRRAYHNVTCHYNVFWNGMMSQIEGLDNLKGKIEDDYSKVLPVYNYGTKLDAKQLNPKMDRTIKKASIAIQQHSMFFGGKERVKWVKQSYLLMGKAYFFKQEYMSARRVFDYVAKEYADDPITYEAMLWLAKTYIQTEYFQKADAILNKMATKKNDKDFPNDVYRNMPLVNADMYLAQKKYDAAYPFLERGLELVKNRDLRARLNFIMGQINQKEGDFIKAAIYYKKVIKSNPPFKMAFESKLNLAKCYTGNSGSSKEILKVLNKMLKDTKNKEYRDQIYYALSDIALKDNNDTLAIQYLKKSVSASTNNKKQKAVSSLQLGNLFFDRGNYVASQAYFDTAVIFMPMDFPNREKIKEKSSVLSSMVQYLETIRTQDSLQKLAKMDSTSLYAVIDNQIEQYKLDQQQIQEEKAQAQQAGGTQFVSPGRRNSGIALGGSAGWYFYNPTTKASGYTEFLRKWGQRKLEDNWFLTDKRQMMSTFQPGDESDTTAKDTTTIAGANNPEKRAYYLKNLPQTEADFKASDSLLVEAYNKLAFIYREDLHDTVHAVNTYQNLEEKFSHNRYELDTWFALYTIYHAQKKVEKANHYKKLILSNYPDSDYAKVMIDPDYFTKKASGQNKASKLYEKAYDAFQKNQYLRVIAYADKGLKQAGGDTALAPRFMFLKAIALGKVNLPDTLYTAMKKLLQDFPQSAVSPMAKDILQMLAEQYGIGDTATLKKIAKGEKEIQSPYTFKPNSPHFVMLIVLSDKVRVRPLKVRLSDFNRKYFQLKRLRVKSLMLDNQRVIITIGNFSNKKESDNYYFALNNDEYVFSQIDRKSVFINTISMNNYPIFYRGKDQKGYQKFWDKYYKKK